MLTGWLTLTAFLAASANPERAAIGRGPLTVAPTRRVKGHPEAALTLNCGDGKNAGVVQYWQTPFGDLQTPGSHRKPGPVFMQRDGSLMIPNTGRLHRGVYYCLLRHTEGTTLWPYELRVDSEPERSGSGGPLGGAVAAAVLLTFAVGFSAGALARTPVLRCLGAVTTRLRSPRQQHCRTEVTVTTLPPMYDNQAFKMAHNDDNAAYCATKETTTTPPPAKPQRSFRQKRQEAAQDTTAHLEGCDNIEEAGGSQKERNKGCDGEAEEERESCGFHLEDGVSRSECSEDVEEKDGESKEEHEGWRQGREVEDRSKEEHEGWRQGREVEDRSKEEHEGWRQGREVEDRSKEEHEGWRQGGEVEDRSKEEHEGWRQGGEVEDRSKEEHEGWRQGGGVEDRSKEEHEGWRQGREVEDRSKEEHEGWRQGGEVEDRSKEEHEGWRQGGEVEDRSKEEHEGWRQGGEVEDRSKEEHEGWRQGGEVEDRSKEEHEGWRQGGEVEDRSKEDGGERRGNVQEENGGDQDEVKDREKGRKDDGETGSSKQECRRSRVIRLYQYDEDGRRYDHLPEAADPAQRPKQRSLSLTRLNAIMAAASAGPLDTMETGRGEERPRFHMEI